MARFLSLSLALLAFCFAGCQTTPQAQYNTDLVAWRLTKDAVIVYTVAHPVTPQIASVINTNFSKGDANLAAAQLWLNANPQYANTPGMSCPSLATMSVLMDVLDSTIAGGGVVVVKP